MDQNRYFNIKSLTSIPFGGPIGQKPTCVKSLMVLEHLVDHGDFRTVVACWIVLGSSQVESLDLAIADVHGEPQGDGDGRSERHLKYQ